MKKPVTIFDEFDLTDDEFNEIQVKSKNYREDKQ